MLLGFRQPLSGPPRFGAPCRRLPPVAVSGPCIGSAKVQSAATTSAIQRADSAHGMKNLSHICDKAGRQRNHRAGAAGRPGAYLNSFRSIARAIAR